MKIIIEAEIPDRWVKTFVGMLNSMEVLGKSGFTKVVSIRSDGAGDFKPTFKFFTKSGSVRELTPALPIDNLNGKVHYDLVP